MTSPLPVLVIGAGPVGLAAANLLAARGVPVVLVERNPTTSDEAKAISLDDESLRTLQAADKGLHLGALYGGLTVVPFGLDSDKVQPEGVLANDAI